MLKSTSKVQTVFNYIILVMYGLVIFSIPTFSFVSDTYGITWILVITLFVAMAVSLILFGDVQFDIISISIVGFIIITSLSTLAVQQSISRRGITIILMCISSFITYTYVKSNPNTIKPMLSITYIALVLFLLVFMISYGKEIFAFDDRLGSMFGDINDISLVNALGWTLSFYFLLFDKSVFIKIVSAILAVLFVVCGVSSGSKIFILVFCTTFLFLVTYKNGKKRWYLTVIMIVLLVIGFIIFLTVPVFSSISERIIDSIESILGIGSDASTEHRTTMFVYGLRMFMKKPLFGYGFNGFTYYSGYTGWSHNHFSDSLSCFGLVGTILWHTGLVLSIYNFIKQYKENGKTFDIAISISVCVLFITAFISIPQFNMKLYAFLTPLCYYTLAKPKTLFSFKISKLFSKKDKKEKQKQPIEETTI